MSRIARSQRKPATDHLFRVRGAVAQITLDDTLTDHERVGLLQQVQAQIDKDIARLCEPKAPPCSDEEFLGLLEW